jgi:hypothetical protein
MKNVGFSFLPRGLGRIAGLVITLIIASMAAQGAVIGNFATDGNGTNVHVSLFSLIFDAPPNLKVTSSSLTYDGGTPLTVGTTGTVANINGPLPIDFFMTFMGTPLDFKLLSVGPGDLTDPHDCSTATSNGKSCSLLLPGNVVSPIVLTYDNNGTDAVLFVSGTVTDGSGFTSNWTGHLGTTLTALLSTITTPAGMAVAPTPVNVFNYFSANPNGQINSSHSDTFATTLIPEPETTSMTVIGAGLLAWGFWRRRSRA